MEKRIESLLMRIRIKGDGLAEELEQMLNEGTLITVPFKRGEWSWHVFPMSKTNSKRGWTKRLVSWEQMVAGLAKDPNGIYVKYRAHADRLIEELKKNG